MVVVKKRKNRELTFQRTMNKNYKKYNIEKIPSKSGEFKKLSESTDSIETELDILLYSKSLFSGPLPHPDTLKHYEKIIPGSAERILTMVEKQYNLKQELEEKYLENIYRDIRRVGAFTALQGQEIPGSLIGTSGVGILVAFFIIGSKKLLKE